MSRRSALRQRAAMTYTQIFTITISLAKDADSSYIPSQRSSVPHRLARVDPYWHSFIFNSVPASFLAYQRIQFILFATSYFSVPIP